MTTARCIAHVDVDSESIRRGGSCRFAACSCGWRGPERSTLELAVDDALLHEGSGCQVTQKPPIPTRAAATAPLVTCALCQLGFRRVDGIHVGSQRLGMIPHTPCDRVFTVHDAGAWIAYVDGAPLARTGRAARRFTTAEAAYAAAREAARRRWHP